ncbi:MAG: hypothetical protein HYS89_00240 [Candidatus Colwellbacteria bacterium]|nr:hypothetical protein [Candidatus Colwellbacteria bacterium]
MLPKIEGRDELLPEDLFDELRELCRSDTDRLRHGPERAVEIVASDLEAPPATEQILG